MKKRLALGHQEFSQVINNNCIYVDKTEIIYKLLTEGTHYFLSRPRRFGKSLLANTIKELYLGRKELFKGLWIYDKWDWETTYPVIKFSFSIIDYVEHGLNKAINLELDEIAKSYNIILKGKTNGDKFKELIIKLSVKGQVAIIIDEYDKPIIDYIHECVNAKEVGNCQADINRKILKNFYSVLKDLDSHIKFFFVTGVSKFSRVSIFSDLNNLIDITIDKNYSQIVGWTINEVEKYFSDYIKEVAEVYKDIYSDIMPEMKKMYDGYSWDGKNFVYNPVSLMNLFGKREFGNYWFETGTPTFLMELIKKQGKTAFDIENSYTSTSILDKYDFTNINLNSLLFQTGYLTIKNKNLRTRRLTLDYPNKEVDESFSKHIIDTQTSNNIDLTQTLLYKIIDSFSDQKINSFIKNVNIIFKNISYNIIEEKESYYHSLFFLIMKMVGFEIDVEIETIDGRIDAVVKTETNIYIIEFKINQSAEKAIQQIRDKKYALKYASDKRPIILIGINFDTEKKIISDWKKIEN